MKPMLFNGEMVMAILDGRKTQTRRIVKGIGDIPTPYGVELSPEDDGSFQMFDFLYGYIDGTNCVDCFRTVRAPYKPGDVLYVRETWKNATGDTAGGGYGLFDTYIYKADGKAKDNYPIEQLMVENRWRPSIHMPKEAARIFLRVTNVSTERLQEIRAEDCVSEGAVRKPNITKRGDLVIHGRYRKEFAALWDSTVQYPYRPKYGWDANPWVWVIEFERCYPQNST